ncbi:MAG: MarR family transcriptional regulator [Peptococcaceae bacterium]|nr:MarR family transcriptional regulator [Peptococcaceae bacterium]
MSEERTDQYLERVERVMAGLMRHMHLTLRKCAPPDVSHSQLILCKRVRQAGRMRVSDLAENLGVSLSAITAAADRLCKNDILRRTRDERDRRQVWLELTPQGERIVGEALDKWRDALRQYFSQLPMGDMERLTIICEKLMNIIQRDKGKNAPD